LFLSQDESISPSTAGGSAERISKRPSPLRRRKSTSKDPDIIITKVDTPIYPETLSPPKKVLPLKLFLSGKKAEVVRASAVRVKTGQPKRAASLARKFVKKLSANTVPVAEKVVSIKKSPSMNSLESKSRSANHDADASDDIIVLDDDDDNEEINLPLKCHITGQSSTKVIGSQVTDLNPVSPVEFASPGSPVKGSSHCGLPSSVKRPMILGKGPQTEETVDVSDSKKVKLDFEEHHQN
jgi:hypothetical protein